MCSAQEAASRQHRTSTTKARGGAWTEQERGQGHGVSEDKSKWKSMCYLLPEIHRKPHVPNVTLAVIKAPENGHIRLTGFDLIYIILHFARFPAYNGIFTRLKERNKRHVLELNFQNKSKSAYFTILD